MATLELPTDNPTAGDYYTIQVELNGVDFSAGTFAAQIRQGPGIEWPLIAEWTIDSHAYADTKTTVVMHLDEDQMRDVEAVGRVFWDLQIILGGHTYTLVKQWLTVERDATE